MPQRKEQPVYASTGEKDNWHPYHLQSLAPNKFVGIVGKILTGKYRLVTPRVRKSA